MSYIWYVPLDDIESFEIILTMARFASHVWVPRQSCVPLPFRGGDGPGHTAQSWGGNPELGRP